MNAVEEIGDAQGTADLGGARVPGPGAGAAYDALPGVSS